MKTLASLTSIPLKGEAVHTWGEIWSSQAWELTSNEQYNRENHKDHYASESRIHHCVVNNEDHGQPLGSIRRVLMFDRGASLTLHLCAYPTRLGCIHMQIPFLALKYLRSSLRKCINFAYFSCYSPQRSF